MNAELTTREADNVFYDVTVTVDEEYETKKGSIKIKKVKEHHLVDAVDPTDVQKKVLLCMNGTIYNWEITSIKKSNLTIVY